jgi:plastocyanin
MSRSSFWVAMIALTSIVAGCSSESKHQSSSGTSGYREGEKTAAVDAPVEITSSMTFSPRDVTIHAGESIVWKNSSNESHTVTCDPMKVANRDDVALPTGAKAFHSGDIRPGKTWRQTFTTAGTYRYVCLMHEKEGMTGTITVRPTEPQTH